MITSKQNVLHTYLLLADRLDADCFFGGFSALTVEEDEGLAVSGFFGL